jgi:hypothetical protein
VSNPSLFSAGPAVATNGNLTYTPAANANGTSTFQVKVQDNGGTANGGVDTSDLQMFTITVNPVNDAPTLDASKSPVLTTETEDAPAPSGAVGTLVSSLVDFATPAGQVDNVTDIDSSPLLGIAITGIDMLNGSWFYSINNGGTWTPFPAPPAGNAVLLAADANTRLYFQPKLDFNGTIAAAITFRAWDQTSGTNGGLANTSTTGGTTAFSTATDTASLTITAVNDAPTIIGQMPVSTAFNTARTIMFSDLQVTDIDNTYPTGFVLTVMAGVNYSLGGNTVTPANNFFGTLTVPVKVNDGALDSNTFQLSMTVNPDANYAKSATKIAKDPGGYKVSFIGNPGQQYTVQYVGFLPATLPQWNFISFQTAQPDGTFFIIDNPPAGTTKRFYRAIIP